MYNGPSVNVTDRPFVNAVHYQCVALFLSFLFESKLGLYSVNTKETSTSTLRLLKTQKHKLKKHKTQRNIQL